MANKIPGQTEIPLPSGTTRRSPRPTPAQIDIHTYFGLSYANYKVLHRTLLQSMPLRWQYRFVRLMQELAAAFEHVPQADGYDVTPGQWVYAYECEASVLKTLGIVAREDPDDGYYNTKTGEDISPHGYVFIPGDDPVPHYNRGRTHIEPRLEKKSA